MRLRRPPGEYDRYQIAQQQESDTAQYAAESDQQQVASLNALNGAFFPPPIIWIGGFVRSTFWRRRTSEVVEEDMAAGTEVATAVVTAAWWRRRPWRWTEVTGASWPHYCSL